MMLNNLKVIYLYLLWCIDLLLKLLCEGYTSEVKRLLRGAPDELKFLDY
jgi:hypothetical protein